MDVYASGRILGVRDRGAWLNRETGEMVDYTTKALDVYDPASGPGQLFAPVDMEIPAEGTECTFRIQLRAKSNFAGDTVEMRVTEIVAESAAATRRRLRAAES